jgi:hypothetical protein
MEKKGDERMAGGGWMRKRMENERNCRAEGRGNDWRAVSGIR